MNWAVFILLGLAGLIVIVACALTAHESDLDEPPYPKGSEYDDEEE